MRKDIHGKIKLKACTLLMPSEREIGAAVYIHLKGYARTRVSHLDVEKMGLGKAIHRGRGNFLEMKGVEEGLEIVLKENRRIALDGEEVTVSSIILSNPLLTSIIEKGKSTKAWVGRKHDGVYIGFRKAELERLEKQALERLEPQPSKIR